MHFGSWIGGDRDGNPNVVTDVTAETLRLDRGLAVEKHRQHLRDLERELSISDYHATISDDLRKSLALDFVAPSDHLRDLQTRYPNEPYRLKLAALVEQLGETTLDPVKERLLGQVQAPLPKLNSASELSSALDVMATSLHADRGALIAEDDLRTLQVQVNVFGLQTPRLDIRQESSRLISDVDALLYAIA